MVETQIFSLNMVTELSKEDSICLQIITELRNKRIQDNRYLFRNNLRKLGWFTAYEISKHLNYNSSEIETPLAKMQSGFLESKVVLLPILRAGIPFFNGFEDVYSNAEVGFIGSWREEGVEHENPESKVGYVTSPQLDNKTVILVDTMLATGNSIIESLTYLSKFGTPESLHVACVIASEAGINFVNEKLEGKGHIWATAIDPELNSNAYIVPGLGDAGDLSYGHKLH